MPAVGQNSIYQTAACAHDLTGYLYEVDQEALELHSQDISARRGLQSYESIPSLKIPDQRRDNHVGPIRKQTVRRHPERIDATLQLADDVLLVATVVGEKDNFLHRHLTIVRDVEKIPLMPISELSIYVHDEQARNSGSRYRLF